MEGTKVIHISSQRKCPEHSRAKMILKECPTPRSIVVAYQEETAQLVLKHTCSQYYLIKFVGWASCPLSPAQMGFMA